MENGHLPAPSGWGRQVVIYLSTYALPLFICLHVVISVVSCYFFFTLSYNQDMLRRSLTLALTAPTHTECLIGIENAIATVTFNRPARKNAIGTVFLSELRAAIDFCRDNAPSGDVRAVVIASAVDRVFCAGADLKERKEMSPEEARAFVDSLRSALCAIEDLPIPTICAIEGAALGGGLEVALATDIRIAGVEAKLGVPETGLAIIPGAGGTQRLPRTVGPAHAKELAFTGLPVDGKRAADIGLVNHVVEKGGALGRAIEMATAISKNGPIAVQCAKRAIVDGAFLGRDEAMAVERKQYEVVLGTKDRLEGLAAFQERRKPVYKGQ